MEEEQREEENPEKPEEKKKGKFKLILLIVFLALSIGAGGTYFFFGDKIIQRISGISEGTAEHKKDKKSQTTVRLWQSMETAVNGWHTEVFAMGLAPLVDGTCSRQIVAVQRGSACGFHSPRFNTHQRVSDVENGRRSASAVHGVAVQEVASSTKIFLDLKLNA